MIGIKIDGSKLAKSDLETLNLVLNRRYVNAAVQRGAVNVIRKKFYSLNSTRPNKMGGKRTNTWAQLARSTNGRDVGDGVMISINHVAARQLYEGGTITPKTGKYLTIPYRPLAYGKRAREFDNLEFAIAEITIEGRKVTMPVLEDKGTKEVYYSLAKKVNQKGDKTILPTEEELLQAVSIEVEKALKVAGTRAI